MLLILFYIIDYYLTGLIITSIFDYMENNSIDLVEFFMKLSVWPIILFLIIYSLFD